MMEFFKYPRRSFEAHSTALSVGIKLFDSRIVDDAGLFVVVLTDPRMVMWVYLLVGYGVPISRLRVLTPNEEIGAELFMGSGSFPELNVVIGDPLESLHELRRSVRVLVCGSTLDSVVPDIPFIRHFAEVALVDQGLLILDYPSTFVYVTPRDDTPEALKDDPYQRFTDIANRYDASKPDGPDNAYYTLMGVAGEEGLRLLYSHLDQGVPRVAFVSTVFFMAPDVREDGLLFPVSIAVVNMKRISTSKSVKALQRVRDHLRQADTPVRVIPLRFYVPSKEEPHTFPDGALRLLRLKVGLHPDETGFDQVLRTLDPTPKDT